MAKISQTIHINVGLSLWSAIKMRIAGFKNLTQKEKLDINPDLVNHIKRDTVPTCFYCGEDYIQDKMHCSDKHSTWKPNCQCLNKTTIRVVTGG